VFVLGLMGSPRRNGNTDRLLSAFLEGAEEMDAQVLKLSVAEKNIAPCQGCGFCEREGRCRIDDDDMVEIYQLLRRADIVAVATPIFFYGPSAQLKALIDRCQALWARRYIYKLREPKTSFRKGFALAVGATRGKELFSGLSLTAKYFFDAISASFEGVLGIRQVEAPGDISGHPTALAEAREKGRALAESLASRTKVLFVCRENASRSQMAEAFLQWYAGESFEAESAGDQPADEINPVVVEVMAEKGIDVAYRKPKGLPELNLESRPFDIVVSLGCEVTCPAVPGAKVEDWELEDPAGKPITFSREIRDTIEDKVRTLVENRDAGEGHHAE